MNPTDLSFDRKLVSVVIPARNAASTIAPLLRSLIPDRRWLKEILLVDDGSEDATGAIAIEIAQRHGLPLRVLPVVFGAAGEARNFGMAQAQGEFLFFVDADDELVSGALEHLATKLIENPAAGLAVGACVRQTASRRDKIKIPHGYTEDCEANVVRYLANELWPIAMGSALIVTSQAVGVRFPLAIGLDEDTFFWAALLARVRVVISPDPVLFYKLDEARMSQRFTLDPRKTLLGISREFKNLAAYGVPEFSAKRRVVWVALRIVRQLIMDRRYSEARGMMRLVRQHPSFRRTRKVFRYACRIQAGEFFQRLGLRKPYRTQSRVESEKGCRRTLMITVDSAEKPVSGADLRNHQNARAAATLGPVRVVSIGPRQGDGLAAQPGIEFCSVGVPGEKSRSLSSWRCSVEQRIASQCLPRLLETIRDFSPDVILVEGIPLAALLKPLRPLTKCLVLDMHNVESDLAASRRRRAVGKRDWLAGWWSDAARVKRLEARAIQWVDRIWVCSEPDQGRLVKLHQPRAAIHWVPNGLPRFEWLQEDALLPVREGVDGPILLFVGHLGYWPNVAAAKRLAKNILPAVRERHPSARLILAGRYPNPEVQSLSALPGVEFYANPDCLLEFYERAHVAVVPLSEGGGTRIKVLEAMAVGLPVVATAVAVEGLGLIDPEEVLLASSDQGIVQHICDLSANEDARLKQRRCAEKTVRMRFGPEAVDFAVKAGLS